MDLPPSKAVKQKDVVSESDSGNLSEKIAGNLQGYIEEEGRRGFSLLVGRIIFALIFPCACSRNS